jgi:hypothetical protein
MVGRELLPADYNKLLDNYRRDGTTLKVNLCLKGLPKFKCLPENKGQYGTTTRIFHFPEWSFGDDWRAVGRE